MTWYEAILLTIAVFAGLFAVFFAPLLLASVFDKIIEGIRRKKHPEYFKYWDAALALSFARGAEYNKRKEHFNYCFKLYTEGLRDGECTNQYFTEQMNKLMLEYQELCSWFQVKEKEIKELLVKADLYAKEHNLSWGIVYDTKQK
jgi:hypothetical protein